MRRYIDADALIRKIQEGHKFGSLTITELISECPTADVVEVVRCKECIHMGTDKCPSRLNDADFYCCQGEMKEVEDEQIH